MVAVYTAVSYLVLFGVVGAWVWHSKGQPAFWNKLASTSSTDASSTSKAKSSRRAKRHVPDKEGRSYSFEGVSSEDRDSKKRKTKAPSLTQAFATGSDFDEEAVNNKAFAERLNRARVGDKLAPPQAKTGNKTKAPKASFSPEISIANSATTGDADDDRSPSPSPGLPPSSSFDAVADMLEKPVAAPVSLRITGEAPAKKAPKTSQKAQEPIETAKQRRARQKREEQKALNEEAERVRRQLEEQQRRGARMAEGSSKQQRADAFAKSAQTNAWAQPVKKENAPPTNPTQWQPLDTFDGSNSTNGINGTSSSATTVGTAPSVGSSEDGAAAANPSSWIDNIPSEEEQLRRFQQQDEESNWNTVSIKKKRGKQGNDASSNEGGAIDERQVQNSAKPASTSNVRPGATAMNSYGVLKNESD